MQYIECNTDIQNSSFEIYLINENDKNLLVHLTEAREIVSIIIHYCEMLNVYKLRVTGDFKTTMEIYFGVRNYFASIEKSIEVV